MNAKKPDLDIINDLLEKCILAYPVSSFIISLYKQYMQRGSLSKKQLEGLYGKASKIPNVAVGKLATLEAMIKKMPTRYKSDLPQPAPATEKDHSIKQMIDAVLANYPQHKRVLFFKARHDNNETLSPADLAELKKFILLIK